MEKPWTEEELARGWREVDEDEKFEIPHTEDGRVPFWVTARMMAGPNPSEEEGEFWDRWKDEMKESY